MTLQFERLVGEDDNAEFRAGAAYVFERVEDSWVQQAFIKASNPGLDSRFGTRLALAADGSTLAVGATREASGVIGINGDQGDELAPAAGAVYVFTRDELEAWTQVAYVKASNTNPDDELGVSAALSADGRVLAVGADREDGNATGVNGDQSDNTAAVAGAVYVY